MSKTIGLLIIIATFGCSSGHRKINVEKNCDACEQQRVDFIVRKIEINETKTNLLFTIRNKRENETYWFIIHPPGTNKSFFIIDSDSGQKFKLLNVIGVPVYPQKIELNPNEFKTFNLEFERLDNSSKKIHLIGGESEEGVNVAQFMSIDL